MLVKVGMYCTNTAYDVCCQKCQHNCRIHFPLQLAQGTSKAKKVKYCFPYDKVYEATQNALKRILCLAHISARTHDKQSRAELIKREK